MGRGRQEYFSKEDIRERVNRVMDAWRSYPDFAHLFAALLNANGIGVKSFARDYSEVTGRHLSYQVLARLRAGHEPPSYQVVADLADHALLSLDPERVRPADGSSSAGDHRIALFTAAGLIEVTPETTAHWNQEVLAGWQNRLHDPDPTRYRPNWKELMRKLLGFRMQGGREHYQDIALAVSAQAGADCQPDAQRVRDILFAHSVPTPAERVGLAKAAGLSPSQTELIEAAVEDGTLPLGRRPMPSSFSALLGEILGRLGACGISQSQLALRTARPGTSKPQLSETTISAWKLGNAQPTLAALRALVFGLERCRDAENRRLVMDEEIRQLVSAAGFTQADLDATTHKIVARIDGTTRIKPLLAALRNAADLNVSASALNNGDGGNGAVNFAAMVLMWENESSHNMPTSSQVLDLLACYNELLLSKGQAELGAEEMQKVADVAQRDRDDGLRHGLRKRAQGHRPITPRRVITPGFDDGPARG